MLTVLLGLSALYWLAAAVTVGWSRARVPVLSALPLRPLPRWPTVSIIVPARDEGAHLHEALRAKLADGYPALQVLVVDDRSTDDTGAQARALGDPRVVVTRVEELPEGWLGKVHALQRGVEASTSEWLLFSDADVHLAPGTLARTIAWAEERQFDFIGAIPSVHAGTFGVVWSLQSFMRLIILGARLPLVERAESTAAMGVGAFNLVRRAALARSPGFEWLKMEIADDMGLGVMMKKSGARCAATVAGDAVSLQFYPSLRVMTKALEKNGAQAPAAAMVLGNLALAAVELGFYAGFFSSWWWAAALVWLLAAVTDFTLASWLRAPRWPAVLPGFGVLPLCFAVARSSVLAAIRGGVVWRGTFYSIAAVRAGQRLK